MREPCSILVERLQSRHPQLIRGKSREWLQSQEMLWGAFFSCQCTCCSRQHRALTGCFRASWRRRLYTQTLVLIARSLLSLRTARLGGEGLKASKRNALFLPLL